MTSNPFEHPVELSKSGSSYTATEMQINPDEKRRAAQQRKEAELIHAVVEHFINELRNLRTNVKVVPEEPAPAPTDTTDTEGGNDNSSL